VYYCRVRLSIDQHYDFPGEIVKNYNDIRAKNLVEYHNTLLCGDHKTVPVANACRRTFRVNFDIFFFHSDKVITCDTINNECNCSV